MKNDFAFPTPFIINSEGDIVSADGYMSGGMTMLELYAGFALASLSEEEAIALNLHGAEGRAKYCFDAAEFMCQEAEKRRGK